MIGADHVRQDLDEHDVRRALAAQARRGDVVELALGSTAARTVRATSGVNSTPTTTISVRFEWPSATIVITPSTISGIARSASTNRLTTSSTSPRK